MTGFFRAFPALVLLILVLGFGQTTTRTHAQTMPGNPPVDAAPEIVPDQLLVRFRSTASEQAIQELLSRQGLTQLGHVPALGVRVLRLPRGLSVERALEIVARRPEVEFVEPNAIVRLAQIADPGLQNQWAPQQIGAPAAWNSVEGDPSVVIAVVDTGVDYRHTELAPNMWQNDDLPANGIDDDANGYIDDRYGWDYHNSDNDPMDDHMHGTHVAGIAAAAPTQNSAGMIGICPRCSIMAVKVIGADGRGTLDALANGLTYAADNGARVINMSLGATSGSATLQAAVDYAWDHGLLLAAAAGNNGDGTRLYPASYANAVAVAASTSLDNRACFSNYGDGYVTVAAPGQSIYSTTPLDSAGNDTYAAASGTSMATPHVAGLAGLLFSQNPNRNNADIRALIEGSTDDMGPAGRDSAFGFGRINVLRAIQGDTSPTVPPAGIFSADLTASGYPHARKLARDASGRLHLVWHNQSNGQYQVLYATSDDGGATWNPAETVFESDAETYHPALALDDTSIYLVYPSKSGSANYRIFFTRKPLAGDAWSVPVALTSGGYQAVRPDLFLDPTNGRLHMAAASFDDAPYVYYTSSDDGGASWSAVRQINVDSNGSQDTRYADVYANGAHVYIAGRTVEVIVLIGILPIPRYRLFSVRSLDGGATWSDLTQLAMADNSDAGVALAGMGDRLYLGYEAGGAIYFRRSDAGVNWSSAENRGTGLWPSLTQGADGQAWLMWESSGSLLLSHYSGAGWDPTETVLPASSLSKGYYPNLKPDASGDLVEWVATSCSGAPYRLMYGSRVRADIPPPPEAQFGAANYPANESDASVTIQVTLSAASASAVTVNYATSNATAIAGSDYTAASGTLTFNPGETSKSFNVMLREDTRDEPEETIALALSAPNHATLGARSSATITIADNDLPPTVAFSSSNYKVHENAGSATITARLSAPSGYPVSVHYATSNGSAIAGSDYTTTDGTLTFNPGETSKSFSVPILEETLSEADETATLSLSNPSNATLGTPASVPLIIQANDTLAFSSSNYKVHENIGSATITARLNAPSSHEVTVNYATSNGSAIAGSDYTAVNGILTFNPGETSKSFSVPILEETLSEADETATLSLSNPANATLGTPASVSLIIQANDTLAFSSSNYKVHENIGSATITARLNAPSSHEVTVNYATSNGSAIAGSDYTAVNGILTFNPGETSKSFSVPILEETLSEADETATLSLSNPANATLGTPASVSLIIQANDTLAFSSSNYKVHENIGSATITVKLNAPSSAVVTVNYATSNGSAIAGSDYTAVNGILTFNPGETSKSFSVPILEETLSETDETATLSLSNPSNATLGTPASVPLIIQANDTLTFSSSSTSVNESVAAATITVKLNAPSSAVVTVNYATSNGSALAGSDYTAASGTLTFNPGETSKTFSVPIVNDTLDEPNETVGVTLQTPNNATLGTPSSATLTIVDND